MASKNETSGKSSVWERVNESGDGNEVVNQGRMGMGTGNGAGGNANASAGNERIVFGCIDWERVIENGDGNGNGNGNGVLNQRRTGTGNGGGRNGNANANARNERVVFGCVALRHLVHNYQFGKRKYDRLNSHIDLLESEVTLMQKVLDSIRRRRDASGEENQKQLDLIMSMDRIVVSHPENVGLVHQLRTVGYDGVIEVNLF